MAYLSPGVYVKEVDNSPIVPTVSNSTAFFAGNFTKGPIEQPFVVTNKSELEYYFGQPTNDNYNEWFQCSKFFDYSNQLVLSRVYTEEGPYSDINKNSLGQEIYPIGTGLLGVQGSGPFYLDSIEDIYINTLFQLTSNDDEKYIVSELAYNDTVNKYEVYFRNVSSPEDNPTGLSSATVPNELLEISRKHINSSIDAPLNSDELNFVPRPSFAQEHNLYKNREDFDFKLDGIDFKPEDKLKLKFIARTAGSVNNNIDIAIVNYYDFQDYVETGTDGVTVSTSTRAQAFEGISILNFFDYPPIEGETGIIVRTTDKFGNTLETESYVVSFEEDAVNGNSKSMYIENIINDNSNLVYCVVNSAEGKTDISIFLDNSTGEPIEVSPKPLVDVQSYIFMDSQGSTAAVPLPQLTSPNSTPSGREGNFVSGSLNFFGGDAPKVTNEGDIKEAYNEVEDKEVYEIDVVIGNELDEGAGAMNLVVAREDSIAFIGANYGDVVGKKSGVITDNLVKYIQANNIERSMFGSFFGNYFRIFDNYAKKFRWINCAGDMAGLRSNTNSNQASWWASAGLKRGVVRNIDRVGFSPNLPQRDNLYKNNINPIVSFPREGNLVWGQKTLLNYSSSFDRINVRGLFNTIERAMSRAARSSLFEFNDPFTRNAILAMFNPYLSTVKAGRGIDDFLVICDTTNNTPDIISRNELVVDIYIRPAYAAEFIQLTFNNVGTRSFSSVIGA